MDAIKRTPGMRGIVSLAYDTRRTSKRSPYRRYDEGQSVPGPLFDVFVIGFFVVSLICYLA